MADMLDAKDAKARLGCDDATLINYINSGALRAQRVGGKFLVNAEDVDKMVHDDEGTIVLTGDSENLSIDLGKVVDDSSATIVSSSARNTKKDDDSITFGDELEVVSFDDGNTKPLNFDDDSSGRSGTSTKATSQAAGLNFTDSNTAVITSVDETQVGATTGIIETGVQHDLDRANPSLASESSRRSVRSTRVVVEAPKVGVLWILLMAVTLIIGLIFTAPYYAVAMWPSSSEKDAANNVKRGLADGFYANMAGGSPLAGFSVEPNKEVYTKINAGGSPWRDVSGGYYQETQADWRYLKWLKPEGVAEKLSIERRTDMVTIRKISADGKTASSVDDLKTYPVVERTVHSGNSDAIRRGPDLGDGIR